MVFDVVTDKGIVKEVNQDSIYVKEMVINSNTKVVFGVICDGMGGLSKGEVASSNLIVDLDIWFQNEFPLYYESENLIKQSLKTCISNFNKRLFAYGEREGIKVGTTVSGILVFDDKYITVNIGDSRVYLMRQGDFRCLTKDHSYVESEVAMGRMTESEARSSDLSGILTRCVGVYEDTLPDFTSGDVLWGDVFFFCSDGARRLVYDNEICEALSLENLREGLRRIISLNIQRKEEDNISVGAIKVT